MYDGDNNKSPNLNDNDNDDYAAPTRSRRSVGFFLSFSAK